MACKEVKSAFLDFSYSPGDLIEECSRKLEQVDFLYDNTSIKMHETRHAKSVKNFLRYRSFTQFMVAFLEQENVIQHETFVWLMAHCFFSL